MAGIETKTVDGMNTVNEGSFAESMQNLEKLLTPGIAVALQNYTFELGTSGKRTEQTIFLSGGHLNEKGIFDIQKGKRNFPYALFYGDDSNDYRIVCHRNALLDNYQIHVPRGWETDEFNEGSFSPAGATKWRAFHEAGTENVTIGDEVAKQFPDIINALKFAEDAVQFSLPDFHIIQDYLITEVGDDKIKGQKEQRARQANRMVKLGACINLISEANRELNCSLDLINVNAIQVGFFDNWKQSSLNKYPVDGNDYLIRESSFKRKPIAFIKIGRALRGEVFILPFNKETKQIVESAFSEERTKKYYL